MAQPKSNSSNNGSGGDGRSRSSSSSKAGGGAMPQMLLVELKQRILAALNKLADRDTQHMGVEDLERIAETLTPEGISLCLSCLYDTDSQQKITVRKECVNMFGTLASFHDNLLAPHLSKIVINIVKRLRDPDSSIRDACVDAIGTLAAKVSLASSGGGENATAVFAGALGVFAKPLFDVLNEQSRSVQVGAAMCLAGVIDNLKDPPLPGSLQRLCPRIIKLLNSPTFTAKAALLSVIASISQAGGTTSYQCLAMVIACVQECLKSNDWATRKAASETLACMASSIGPSLNTFKISVLEALEACRFDKVKPVRDMVVQTLQVWKRIPNSDLAPDGISAVKENTCMESQECQLTKRKGKGLGEAATVLKHMAQSDSDYDLRDGGCFGFSHSRSAANNIHGNIKKKRTPLVDKRANPPLLGKMEKKDPSNWQIDIALPRALTVGVQEALDIDVSKQHSKERKAFQEYYKPGRIAHHHHELLETYSRRPGEPSDKANIPHIVVENQIFEETVGMNSTKSRSSNTKHSSCIDSTSQFEEVDTGSWSAEAGLVRSSSSSTLDGQVINTENDSALIKRQLCQIENQQTSILELLQKLMNGSEESLLKLETRIAGVESIVGNLITDLANGRCDGNPAQCSSKLHSVSDHSNPKVWKKRELCGYLQEKPVSSEGITSARGGQNLPLRSLQSGTDITGFINESRFGPAACVPLLGNPFSKTQANSWRVDVDVSSDSLQRRTRNEADSNSFLSKDMQERGPVSSRLGESASVRSIWQGSKDESTLLPFRVVREDGRVKVPESLKVMPGSSQLIAEQKAEVLMHKMGGQGKGPFWSVWARVAGFLRSGDVDLAYVEVLCAGDELLLVRLMSRTGPVLERLSNGTAHELLRAIIQLMLQQSFLDVIIPWVQQVADLVTSNGSDCLAFSVDAKRELITSLEAASASNHPEKWIATALHELAAQLATS